jgi:predicted Holliday junction resolvase-like endonuclease
MIEQIIYIIILVIMAFIIYKKMPLLKADKKSATVKKSQILDEYKKQLDDISFKYKNDKETQKLEKTKQLKQINQELSQNIFFDKSEHLNAMQELTKYSFS